MKAKLMALMLAVGLGVTGVAVTAQAASEEGGCSHPASSKEISTELLYADFCNPDGHYSTYKVVETCKICNEVNTYTEYKFESHDYEQIFLDNGRVLLKCTGCGDQYYWM